MSSILSKLFSNQSRNQFGLVLRAPHRTIGVALDLIDASWLERHPIDLETTNTEQGSKQTAEIPSKRHQGSAVKSLPGQKRIKRKLLCSRWHVHTVWNQRKSSLRNYRKAETVTVDDYLKMIGRECRKKNNPISIRTMAMDWNRLNKIIMMEYNEGILSEFCNSAPLTRRSAWCRVDEVN